MAEGLELHSEVFFEKNVLDILNIFMQYFIHIKKLFQFC